MAYRTRSYGSRRPSRSYGARRSRSTVRSRRTTSRKRSAARKSSRGGGTIRIVIEGANPSAVQRPDLSPAASAVAAPPRRAMF